MSKSRRRSTPLAKAVPVFQTTRWSVVIEAGHPSSPDCRAALESLCETYWLPLYAFIRSRGYQVEQSQDLTQEFFAVTLEKNALQVADRNRGKFRSFLLGSVQNFLANQHRASMAKKRGGGRKSLSLDFPAGETQYKFVPADSLTPERIFEREWALVTLERALQNLAAEQSAAGKGQQYEKLQPFLTSQSAESSYPEIAEQLAMTPGAVKVAVHRLRNRYRELLRKEIAHTVSNPDDVDDELQALFLALGP